VNAPAEVVLRSDELEVVLLPNLGARLHRLRAFGEDLLRTPDDPSAHRTDPFFWGAYVMAPWCNRIRPGPVEVAGRTVDLAPNFEDGSAIHGQVSARPWTVDDETLRISGGGDGWPWPYEVTCHAAVAGATLTLAYRLTNHADGAMPAGIGLHPWFRGPVEVGISAATVYPANSGSPPVAEPVSEALDLRTPHRLAPNVDATWASLATPRIDLAWPERGLAARIEVDADRVLVAAASPAHVDAVAVEPQTHGPDALRRLIGGEPDALPMLPPGASLELTLRLTANRARVLR
jgi:aldose 1-epimerase